MSSAKGRPFCLGLNMLILFSGWRLRNFEVRVGQDGVDIGQKAICYKQVPAVADGATVNILCVQDLFGSWVSVNKSDTQAQSEHLQLRELQVFGYRSKWCKTLYDIEEWIDLIYWGVNKMADILQTFLSFGPTDKKPGGRLNKKDGLSRYGDSHVKDKTS